MRCGEPLLVFDGGTGLRLLGKSLSPRRCRSTLHLFFSHVHWDHIQGFPFFGPAFVPGNTIHMYGGDQVAGRVESAMVGQMESPSFPVRLEQLPATLRFHDLRRRATWSSSRPDMRVRCAAGNHPGGVLAYRVEHAGRSVVYMTDHEPDGRRPAAGHRRPRARCRRAHLRLHVHARGVPRGRRTACSRVGWGHSTFEVGRRPRARRGRGRAAPVPPRPGPDRSATWRTRSSAPEAVPEQPCRATRASRSPCPGQGKSAPRERRGVAPRTRRRAQTRRSSRGATRRTAAPRPPERSCT